MSVESKLDQIIELLKYQNTLLSSFVPNNIAKHEGRAVSDVHFGNIKAEVERKLAEAQRMAQEKMRAAGLPGARAVDD